MTRGILIAVVGLGACNGDDGTDTGGDTAAEAATFTRVKDEILTPSCGLSTCHAAPTTNGMELVAGEEHAALVNVPSLVATGEILVIPGDADGSYVVLKLEDAVGIVQNPMPSPFGGLSPALIQLMRDWIDAGALDN